jgi:hypothetical protein
MASEDHDKELLDLATKIADGRPITRAFLVYEAVDRDGLQMMGSYSLEGATPWDLIGMLEFKLAHLRNMAVTTESED